jgi:hypothetical protein
MAGCGRASHADGYGPSESSRGHLSELLIDSGGDQSREPLNRIKGSRRL